MKTMNSAKELGNFDKKFEKVFSLFKNNIESGEEVGASFAVFHEGRLVIDLYGGYRDKAKTKVWDQNTIVNIHSTSKGLVAMIIAHLIDKGQINLDENVATYWPEFAQAGKENIKVRTLLSHQAGLYGWKEKIDELDFYRWDYVVDLLAKQEPFHDPGQEICYHPKTIGFLVGELIRRVTKQTVGSFLKENLSDPLDAKCFIGTPEEYHNNIAELISSESLRKAFSNPGNVDQYMVTAFLNPANRTKTSNTREWRLAEIPAMNCHANARSISKIYDFFMNSRNHENGFISKEIFDLVTKTEIKGNDNVMKSPMQWSCTGYSIGGGKLFGKSNKAFGHTGWGGSVAFGDPENNLSFAYTMNLLTGSMLGDQRALKLVEETYNCL